MKKNGVNLLQERDLLHRRGYKLTEQRCRVLGLLKSERKHLKAIDIHQVLRQKKHRISLATVYRTLDLLDRMHLVRKVEMGNKPSIFEFDGETDKKKEHLHLICRNCGRVIDIWSHQLLPLTDFHEQLVLHNWLYHSSMHPRISEQVFFPP